ncbi:ATP phosphoribosyltransferase regulatory subunit [Paracoccus isoporae]|uniref:ATP phosphoribosyltransferase regulatory subunit n=1 Tax=Paracoccus isoporae TaxID=591205 RepID=A0A1G7ALE9_9RHOB|nr:ATP phosphoribosyltransferase regulatory subunit [Paracoccus isoporae]SDE15297.1 ATP phosphoribosyltransferase regulatory subunit [Paracoccus isoporae]
MVGKAAKLQAGQRLLAAFRDAGAVEVAPDILLDAGTLLDLYGEDIRARAYVTTDPVRGEVVLRPDFTVPVVQMQMRDGAEPARYCYLGEVFRKQDHGDTRPDHPRDNEYLQAGFEIFARDPEADAEIFALFHRLLLPYGLSAAMGDMDILLDAIRALPVSDARRGALLHHVWRPIRFSRLLARYSRPAAPRNLSQTDAPWTGLRTGPQMEARIALLETQPDETPLPAIWADRLTRLFAVDAPAPEAVTALRGLADEIPQIAEAVDRLATRLDQIASRGVDPATIRFAASHGRETMEYYDGMTFTFAADHPDWPPVASGGRYDALTAQLGQGRAIPAVGGIIRPGLIAELEATC